MERKLMMYLPYSSSYLLLTNKKAGETKTGIQLRAGVSPRSGSACVGCLSSREAWQNFPESSGIPVDLWILATNSC